MTTTYETIDYLLDLSQSKINAAKTLSFEPYEPTGVIDSDLLEWDFKASYYTSEDYAILHDEFVFDGKEGATYDIFSRSFFDPFILLLYDNLGNVIATDENKGSYGSDIIFDFVAPYTGKYYINASWDQGIADAHKFVSVSVYEDVDTIPAVPPPTLPPLIEEPGLQPDTGRDNSKAGSTVIDNRDKIFNWAEHFFPDLLPESSESIEIFGYYARTYSNGNAVGAKDGSIYFYNGSEGASDNLSLVGSVTGFLFQAVNDGF